MHSPISYPVMIIIESRLCLCLSCFLIVSLLTFMHVERNNKPIDKDAFLADLRVSSLVLDSSDGIDHL